MILTFTSPVNVHEHPPSFHEWSFQDERYIYVNLDVYYYKVHTKWELVNLYQFACYVCHIQCWNNWLYCRYPNISTNDSGIIFTLAPKLISAFPIFKLPIDTCNTITPWSTSCLGRFFWLFMHASSCNPSSSYSSLSSLALTTI